MKVFISWSGERSGKFAEELHSWLKIVLQRTDPFISQTMDRGVEWFTELKKHLNDSTIGIICITPENQFNSWIQFEAGALLKSTEQNRVIPLLLDMEDTELKKPLSAFNYSVVNKKGILSMLTTINGGFKDGEALSESTLQTVFERNWPDLEKVINEVTKQPVADKPDKRSNNDLLDEILKTVRSLDKQFRGKEFSSENMAKMLRNQLEARAEIDSLIKTNGDPFIAKRYIMDKYELDKSEVDRIINERLNAHF